ncbi:MAG: hypothetical protein Q8Q95_04240 [bacterium]|nr:hypothetical protein [bacterium]
MNALGVGRMASLGGLLRDAGKISLIFFFLLLSIALVCGAFFLFVSDKPEVKVGQGFLVKEYQELSTMSGNLFGLKVSIRMHKQKMISLESNRRSVPKSLWTKKEISDWYEARESYFRLMSDYHRMALEYNLWHEALGYRFMYNKNLPDRLAKALPQRYVPLE